MACAFPARQKLPTRANLASIIGQPDTIALKLWPWLKRGKLLATAQTRALNVLSALTFAAVLSVLSTVPSYAGSHSITSSESLKPHRAIYRMSLGYAKEAASLEAADGHMYYSFEATCEGWETETRVNMDMVYAGDAHSIDVNTEWTFQSVESYDGKQFRFNVEHTRDGRPLDGFDGNAVANGDAYFADEELTKPLTHGTLFPSMHLSHTLAAVRRGDKTFFTDVFDGASRDNPYQVNVFSLGEVLGDGRVGVGPLSALHDVARRGFVQAAAARLPKTPVWRLRMAFFPRTQAIAGGEVLPEFEIEADYRDDGIAQRLVQDFGDFSLNLNAVTFEALPRPDC